MNQFYLRFTDIDEFEDEYQMRDKQDGEYAIGNYIRFNKINNIYIGTTISAKCFFEFPFYKTNAYIYACSKIYRSNYLSKMHIMKCVVNQNDVEMVPIIKTYWVRLVQRHWKSVFIMRTEMIRKQRGINALKMRELGKGNRGSGSLLQNMPNIKGMLSIYKNKKSVLKRRNQNSGNN